MQLKTKTMGTVEVAPEQLISVPSGLFGFEEYTEFALIDSSQHPFIWLQSTQDSSLAFLLIDPFLVCPDYETDIDDRELARIGISEPSQVLVLTLVTIPNNGGPITTNLLGPLIINKTNRQAMQVILNDSKWPVKHDIIKALKSQGEK